MNGANGGPERSFAGAHSGGRIRGARAVSRLCGEQAIVIVQLGTGSS